MIRRQFTRSTLVGGFAVALALASSLVFARQEATASYTGCLNVNGGTIVNVAPGSTPLSPCSSNQIQLHLAGGDITSITAGTGLQGGTTNGDATLSVQLSYRLPQACPPGAVAKWTGSAWECGSDADTAPVAFGGFAEVTLDIPTEGVPDSMDTIGKLRLPAGQYAIFAKVSLEFIEANSDFAFVDCRLIAESDVDSARFGTFESEDNQAGVISLTLLHEFAGEGFAEVACNDGNTLADYADASWSNLRITAIKLGSFENVPLTR